MANGVMTGSGTAASPYLIEDCEDLNAIRNNPSKYYKLTKNLNLASSAYANWTPIVNFTGNFNGNYYNIRNLKIDLDSDNVGFFSTLGKGANISNLGFIDANIAGANSVGILCGSFIGNSIVINNVYVNGTVSGVKDVGGLIGACRVRDACSVSNITTQCNVTGTSENVGGVAGDYTSTSETNISKMFNIFSYSSVKGGNYITTNGCIGLADDITSYSNMFYESIKVDSNYPDEHATACSDDYLKDQTNFIDIFGLLTYTDNDNKKKYLWKFELNKFPRLRFADKLYTLFELDNELYYYTNNEMTKMDVTKDDLTSDMFFEKGIQDVGIFNSLQLHNWFTTYKFNVLTYFDTYLANTDYPVFEVFYNDIVGNIDMEYQTVENVNEHDVDFVDYDAQFVVTKETYDEMKSISVDKSDETVIDSEIINPVSVQSTYDTQVENTDDVSFMVTENVHDSSQDTDSVLNDHRTIEIHSSENQDYSNVQLKIESENITDAESSTNEMGTKVVYDYESDKKNIKGNVFYNVYNTVTTPNRGVYVAAEGENQSRYLLSVSNGKEWLTYNDEEQKWETAVLNDIHTAGVTKEQMLSRAVMNALPTTYQSKVKVAAAISSEAFNSDFHIKDFNIQFETNGGPAISELIAESTDDNVVISGIISDKENDDVKYRILTRHQIETDYRQILPANSNGYLKQKNNYSFKHTFPLSYFKNGSNFLKIETVDSRGKEYNKVVSVTLIEGTPSITLNSNNQFYANFTLNHTQNKKVHFKISINGEQKAPTNGGWTEWKQTPYTFDYTWETKDVLNGLPNQIELVVEDEMGTQDFTKFSVIGEYKSLLFKDENNFYYSTDEGELLQQLEFGTVVGGVYSDVYPVFLENKTGLPMEHISIYADADTQEEFSRVKVSFDNNEFVPAEDINYDKIMENNDICKFYVRIDTDEEVKSYTNKVFKILAKGDPIDEDLIKTYYKATDYDDMVANYDIMKDGVGLYNVQLESLNDGIGIANKNIFIFYDKIYITDPTVISQDDFFNNPLDETTKTTVRADYLTAHTEYKEFSINWLNDFFVDNYGDTFENLKSTGKLKYDAKLEYSQTYDGYQAFIGNNDKVTVTHAWGTVNKV